MKGSSENHQKTLDTMPLNDRPLVGRYYQAAQVRRYNKELIPRGSDQPRYLCNRAIPDEGPEYDSSYRLSPGQSCPRTCVLEVHEYLHLYVMLGPSLNSRGSVQRRYLKSIIRRQ